MTITPTIPSDAGPAPSAPTFVDRLRLTFAAENYVTGGFVINLDTQMVAAVGAKTGRTFISVIPQVVSGRNLLAVFDLDNEPSGLLKLMQDRADGGGGADDDFPEVPNAEAITAVIDLLVFSE